MRTLRIVPLVGILALSVAFGEDAPKKLSTDEAMSAVVMKVDPPLPLAAKQLKIGGAVEMQAVIGENGRVDQVNIVSGNPILTRSAEEALKRWRFKPFTVNGKTVKAVATIHFEFEQ